MKYWRLPSAGNKCVIDFLSLPPPTQWEARQSWSGGYRSQWTCMRGKNVFDPQTYICDLEGHWLWINLVVGWHRSLGDYFQTDGQAIWVWACSQCRVPRTLTGVVTARETGQKGHLVNPRHREQSWHVAWLWEGVFSLLWCILGGAFIGVCLFETSSTLQLSTGMAGSSGTPAGLIEFLQLPSCSSKTPSNIACITAITFKRPLCFCSFPLQPVTYTGSLSHISHKRPVMHAAPGKKAPSLSRDQLFTLALPSPLIAFTAPPTWYKWHG